MKQFRSRDLARTGLITLAAGALVFVTYGGQAYAQDGASGTIGARTEAESQPKVVQASTTTPTDVQTSINSQIAQLKQKMQAEREQTKANLTAQRLKVCQDREKLIDTQMTKMSDNSTDHLNVFTSIATRVEAFYTQKGKTVANYDSLVADVNAKETAAETAIATAKASGASFSCTDANPGLAAQQFKDAHAGVIKALQDYRTAIKNLIVAVKSVQSDAAQSSTTSGNPAITTTTTTQTTGSNQ